MTRFSKKFRTDMIYLIKKTKLSNRVLINELINIVCCLLNEEKNIPFDKLSEVQKDILNIIYKNIEK